MNIRRILREPLLHFLLIGLALFLYFGHVSSDGGDARRIIVSQGQVDDLAQQFQQTWSRAPTAAELRKLVDGYVHDEVLYREGMAAGLGQDDVVIKRRVRQKVEVMAEEEGERAAPTDADLAVYLAAHRDRFEQPAVVSFEQLYFDPALAATPARIAAARAALAKGHAPAGLGQPSMLPPKIEAEGVDLVARDFGTAFAESLAGLPRGQWTGPVPSGLGVHLVRIERWTPPSLPTLDAVRAQVLREWENDRRTQGLDASYQRMRARYQVIVQAKLPGVP